jgi:hypothetical protein
MLYALLMIGAVVFVAWRCRPVKQSVADKYANL